MKARSGAFSPYAIHEGHEGASPCLSLGDLPVGAASPRPYDLPLLTLGAPPPRPCLPPVTFPPSTFNVQRSMPLLSFLSAYRMSAACYNRKALANSARYRHGVASVVLRR